MSRTRGFTLAELMIVVAIIAILAALAVYGVRRYVLVAKTSEATEIINQTRAAEEAYKDETFTYLAISANLDALYPIPKEELGTKKVQWGGGEEATDWRRLGVTPNAPVEFGYACVAATGGSLPTSGIPSALNYPASPGGPWGAGSPRSPT